MNEENMKNYSIRLGSDEVKRLDALSSTHFYWKRSGVIRGILLGVLRALSNQDIYYFILFGLGHKNIEVTININRK